jgi:thioredoxin reductase (NADPH)
MIYDCAVIGAGPAGVAATVHLRRAGLWVALFEKRAVGGLLCNAGGVENYLGVPYGVRGSELALLFGEQLKRLKVEPIQETVTLITDDRRSLIVESDRRSVRSRRVIVATGTAPRPAGMRGEATWAGKRLFYEFQDLPPLPPGTRVLIVGGGDAAVDAALRLRELRVSSLVITRGAVTAAPLLQKRAREQGIGWIEQASVQLVRQRGRKMELLGTAGQSWRADYVLVAVGRKPASPRIRVRRKQAVYWAGDVQNGHCRFVQAAAGDGVRAAHEVIRRTFPSQP